MKGFFWLFALAAVLPLLAPIFWFFELFSHYAVYYAWVSAVFLLLSLLKRWPVETLVLSVIFALNISQIAPYYQKTSPDVSGTPLKIVSQNFFLYNEDFESFQRLIEEEDPDLFAIQEAGPLWEQEMEVYRDEYPYMGFTKSLGVYGTVIASKTPAVFEESDMAGYPTLVAHVFKEDKSFSFFSVHPPAPVHEKVAARRNQGFEELAEEVKKTPGAILVAGDFNCSPWSPHFKELIEESDLKEARKGFGVLPTWTREKIWLRIPIDHLLYNDQLHVQNFETSRATNSDHLPLIAELNLL